MTKQFINFAVQLSLITAAIVAILRLLDVPAFYLKLTLAIGVGVLALSALVLALSNMRLGRSESRPDDGLKAFRANNRARTRHLLRRLDLFLVDLRRTQSGQRLWYRERHSAPWWLVLGPDGHGKSTLLRAAPDAREHAPCEPDSATREPRFFSAAGLAFIEVPEGFEQHPGFARFLARIARKRTAQPFTGALVVARLDSDAPADLLARTRAQLVRLASEFSVRPPVALAITHLDRLAGLVEFCDGLGPLTRPLGVTLTACDSPSAVAQVLRARLAEPLAWVRQRCHSLVARPRDNVQQSNLYSFWQQFDELTQRAIAAASFLAAQPLPGGESLRPRAVYFISADPGVSSPSDAWQERLSRRVGGALPSVPLSAQAPAQAFVRGIFTTELLRDSPLAARLRLFRWRRASIQTLLAAALAGLALHTSLSITRTADAQHAHMQATWDTARVALQFNGNKPTSANLLTALSQQVIPWRDDPSFITAWSLQRGDLLREPSARVYTYAVCAGVLAPLARRSERSLRDFTALFSNGAVPGASEQAKIRDHLRLYTLLSAPRDHEPWRGEEFDWLSGQLRRRWGDDDTASDDDRAAVLQLHAELAPTASPGPADLDPCIGSGGALAVHFDEKLADDTSAILARVPRETGVIDRIVNEINNSRNIQPIMLARGRVTAKLKIPPAFTRQGWKQASRAIDREVNGQQSDLWYLTSGHMVNNRHEYCIKLRNNYVDRYNESWDRGFASIKIQRASSLEELEQILRALIDRKPLSEIFSDLAQHTQRLPPIPCPALGESHNALARTLASALPPLSAPLAAVANRRDSRDIQDKFAHLVDVAVPPPVPQADGDKAEGPPAKLPLDNYHAQLIQLSKKLTEASQNREHLKGLADAARSALGELREQVEIGEFDPWDQAIVALLRPPLDDMVAFGDDYTAGELNTTWCSAVVRPMRKMLLGRYPFDPEVRPQADLEDIHLLFHPTTGAIAKYRDEHLSGLLEVTGTSVVARPLGSDANRHISDSVIAFLDDALKLGRLLFPSDADTPSLDLSFRSTCRAEVSKLTLTVDGAETPYLCGPDQERAVHWPGEKAPPGGGDDPKPSHDRAVTGAKLVAHGKGTQDDMYGSGAFGLFRLLEDFGDPKRIPGRHLAEVTFNFSKFGPLKLTFNPTTVQGGSLFYGFGDGTTAFLAPMRTPRLRNPPEQLFGEFPHSCPPEP